MNQNFTLEQIFPTWYKGAESSITADLVNDRVTAIKKTLEITEIEFWLDIVRTALGIQVQQSSHITTFVKNFQESDINFPITSNNNIVKVLSQITLCALFDEKTDVSLTVSNSLIAAHFFESYTASKIPFYDEAVKFIMNYKEDEFDIKAYTDVLAEAEENIAEEPDELGITNNDVINLINVNNFLLSENIRVKQETNILWWLFGEYSSTFNDYFPNVGVSKMVVASALELHSLNNSETIPASSKHMIAKALIISNNYISKIDKLDLATVINSIPDTVIKQIVNIGHCEELTPILLAINLADQSEDNWPALFTKKIKLKGLDKKYMPSLLAYQLFCELRLVNSLNS
jgi:hypothetical protein